MLRPQDSARRDTRTLDGLWDFELDTASRGRTDGWQNGLPGPRRMAVPGSWNDIYTTREEREFYGDVWYQRRVKVPNGWTEQVILYFESVTHTATVYVDDVQVAEHQGGYLPFEVDITPQVSPGGWFTLTVIANNELTFETIPPGMVQETSAGPRMKYWQDFFNYAGIHRHVWMYNRPALHVDDITVVTGIDGATGIVEYSVEVGGGEPGQGDVRVSLLDESGAVVGSAEGSTGRIEVADANLWGVRKPYLYTLHAEVLTSGEVVDDYRQRIGIRTVAIEGGKLLLNGEPVYLTGFGMHEDHPIVGKQHNDTMMLRDFELLEWIGANSLRTSHYPYSSDVMDYCDEQGILVIDETPAVGQNFGLGGGIFGAGGSLPTFSPDTISTAGQNLHAQMIRDLIARDKNHPCVIIWSIANEPESHTAESEEYFEPLFAVAREADNTRPVGFVNVLLSPHGKCRLHKYADLIMINRYYGWYVNTGDLASAEIDMKAELDAWATEGKPIILTEYGADTYPGEHTLPAEPWSEDYQVAYLESNSAAMDANELVIGEHMWNFADFATTSGIMRVGGNKKGAFTRDRQPKAAAHWLRDRWTNGRIAKQG
ncbi:MAG: beta-glucuronidase [Brooklawnia sp.]|jgi:beta-glucuronidase